MAKPNLALKALGRNKEEVQVRDETSTIRTVRWQFTPSIPVHRDSGVSGWALLDGIVKRVHLCASDPCTARFADSKYSNIPPPVHVRLVEEGDAGGASSPASLAPSPSPPPPPPPAPSTPPPAPPALQPPSPPTSWAPSTPPKLPSSPQPAVAGPVVEISGSKLLDNSLVAPPPAPLPKCSETLPEVVDPQSGLHWYHCLALRLVRKWRRHQWLRRP